MAKKMTIVEQYEAIIEKAKNVLSAEEIEFLNERAELHAKKNASRKPTKEQNENLVHKDNILNFMEKGKKYTVTEIQKGVGLESNQKTSALVRQLKESGKVDRTFDKGKAYFSLI
jgi:hypothetical protein